MNSIRLTILQKKYSDMKEIIISQESPEAIGPYSQAIRAGDFLYVSGQIALDHLTGELKMTTISILRAIFHTFFSCIFLNPNSF